MSRRRRRKSKAAGCPPETRRSRLYFAYGSNLLIEHMLWRCKTAEPVATMVIRDWRLVFRHYADVEPAPGFTVPGALYRVYDDDMRALDLYENVSDGLYSQVPFRVTISDQVEEAFFYRMNANGLSAPASEYLQTLVAGYRDWGLDTEPLVEAWRYSTEVQGDGA